MSSLRASDSGHVRRAALVTLLLGGVSTLGATIYLVARGTGDGPLPIRTALLWQGAIYLAWVPTMAAVAYVVRRSGRFWLGSGLAWWPAMLVHGWAAETATWAMRQTASGPYRELLPQGMSAHLPVEILQYWALVAALAVVETRVRLADHHRAALRLETELAHARLGALRARLQPHFIFNTLQSIAMLIPRDTNAAQQMTVHLGDLLRAGFAKDDGTQEVSLADELRLAEAYLAIEAQRFRERLTVRWEIDDAARTMLVPDLLLQPLLENAVRHGLWPNAGPGTIAISARVRVGALDIEVDDDGLGLPATWRDGASDGTGLGATRARLLGLYGSGASLRVAPRAGGGTIVTVSIPARRAAVERAS